MKVLRDPDCLLNQGLDEIRIQYKLPDGFPADAIAEAEAAIHKPLSDHMDLTHLPFVTLDPASSMDLDQAFAIQRDGADIILKYAIADVAWFVADDGPMDREAWERGTSQYLPDGKVSLYPPILSEGAASLLPDVDRPAVVFTVRVATNGAVKLDAVDRAIIRSRAKLGYENVTPEQLPDGFDDLASRIVKAEAARGASRLDPPEQEVSERDGHFELVMRPQTGAEMSNAALSLATNMAVAELLYAHKTGLFRTMEGPGDWAVGRLRHTARALGLDWPRKVGLAKMEASLDQNVPAQAALMFAIRRSSPGAVYEPYHEGERPWHSAMAATYVHMTAPLRRLADRYVVSAALAIANGKPVPASVTAAFERLPKVMGRADTLGGTIERAVVDLAETIVLEPRVGQTFEAVVTDIDERGARIQLCEEPVVARVKTDGLAPGERINVRLDKSDPATRQLQFTSVASATSA